MAIGAASIRRWHHGFAKLMRACGTQPPVCPGARLFDLLLGRAPVFHTEKPPGAERLFVECWYYVFRG